MEEQTINWCQSSFTCIKRTTEQFTSAEVWKSLVSRYVENTNGLMMKQMRCKLEACSTLMLKANANSDLVLQTGKVKSQRFASCWQQHGACLNHASSKIPPRTGMNPSPFFFWMLKNLHRYSCLLRHWILEDVEYCLDNAKCPQMPFLSMALDTFQPQALIQKKEVKLSQTFLQFPLCQALWHYLGFHPVKCWPFSPFTPSWGWAILYNAYLAWFNT